MARAGRDEALHQWLPLDSWIGMVIDAMLNCKQGSLAMDIYWGKLFRTDLRDKLAHLLDQVASTKAANSTFAAEGLAESMADFFVEAVKAWSTSRMLESPDVAWLRTYLTSEASVVYTATESMDALWAIYSYFVWTARDQSSKHDARLALQDLCGLAGIPFSDATLARDRVFQPVYYPPYDPNELV